jgi:hypothetical protein
MKLAWLAALAAVTLAPPAVAQRNAAADAPFILEHSYWLQPGTTGQFLAMFNRNKLPLLKREVGERRILWMRITQPRLRSADPGQPDLKLTIAWASPNVAFDDKDPARFIPGLFSDAEAHARAEAERERMIVRRSDVPVQEVLIDGP